MEDVYRRLRYSVMTGELRPGRRVKLADLCAEYNVSLSVVREAATRLAEQGLLTAEPNRGFQVLSLSVADLKDLTFMRLEIEPLCLRRSIALGGAAWEANIVGTHHTLVRAGENAASDPDSHMTLTQAHSAFHGALSAACGSPRLLELRERLFDSAELYRCWSLNASGPDRDPRDEHRLLMEATLDRDAETAVEQLVKHIEGTANWFLSSDLISETMDAS